MHALPILSLYNLFEQYLNDLLINVPQSTRSSVLSKFLVFRSLLMETNSPESIINFLKEYKISLNTNTTYLIDSSLFPPMNSPQAKLNYSFLSQYKTLRLFNVINPTFNSFFRCVGFLYIQHLIKIKDFEMLNKFSQTKFFWNTNKFLQEQIFPELNLSLKENIALIIDYWNKNKNEQNLLKFYEDLINKDSYFLESLVILMKNLVLTVLDSSEKCREFEIILSEVERIDILNEIYEYGPRKEKGVERAVIEAMTVVIGLNFEVFSIFFNGNLNKLIRVKQRNNEIDTITLKLIYFDSPHCLYVICHEDKNELNSNQHLKIEKNTLNQAKSMQGADFSYNRPFDINKTPKHKDSDDNQLDFSIPSEQKRPFNLHERENDSFNSFRKTDAQFRNTKLFDRFFSQLEKNTEILRRTLENH